MIDDASWWSVQGTDLVLRLRVRPRASPEGFAGVRAGRILVRISAAPVDGAANQRLMRLLSRELATPLATLVLVRGLSDRDKDILVRGGAARREEIVARLERQ